MYGVSRSVSDRFLVTKAPRHMELSEYAGDRVYRWCCQIGHQASISLDRHCGGMCALKSLCMHAGTPKEAITRWEAAWIDAMLEALASPVPRLAANVSAYGLSVPLAMESGSLVTLLRRILAPASAAGSPHGSYSDGQVVIALHP